jgi:hypothetical protein
MEVFKIMKTRQLFCGKDIIAIGQEGSFADYRERVQTCFKCSESIFCKGFCGYLAELEKQNQNINAIKNHQLAKV